ELEPRTLELAARLRRGGWSAEFSYRTQSVGKALRAASERGAARAVIIGQETREHGLVTVKDLASGRQVQRAWDEFLANPMAPINEGG
ncbi:MAG: His/Gly/Thr/Pro-type tRNA ligase C-terminal domain-containing protein, partial [Phycisphaerae bacterium]